MQSPNCVREYHQGKSYHTCRLGTSMYIVSNDHEHQGAHPPWWETPGQVEAMAQPVCGLEEDGRQSPPIVERRLACAFANTRLAGEGLRANRGRADERGTRTVGPRRMTTSRRTDWRQLARWMRMTMRGLILDMLGRILQARALREPVVDQSVVNQCGSKRRLSPDPRRMRSYRRARFDIEDAAAAPCLQQCGFSRDMTNDRPRGFGVHRAARCDFSRLGLPRKERRGTGWEKGVSSPRVEGCAFCFGLRHKATAVTGVAEDEIDVSEAPGKLLAVRSFHGIATMAEVRGRTDVCVCVCRGASHFEGVCGGLHFEGPGSGDILGLQVPMWVSRASHLCMCEHILRARGETRSSQAFGFFLFHLQEAMVASTSAADQGCCVFVVCVRMCLLRHNPIHTAPHSEKQGSYSMVKRHLRLCESGVGTSGCLFIPTGPAAVREARRGLVARRDLPAVVAWPI